VIAASQYDDTRQPYLVETNRWGCLTILAHDLDEAERLAQDMGYQPTWVAEAVEDEEWWCGWCDRDGVELTSSPCTHLNLCPDCVDAHVQTCALCQAQAAQQAVKPMRRWVVTLYTPARAVEVTAADGDQARKLAYADREFGWAIDLFAFADDGVIIDVQESEDYEREEEE